MTDDKRVEITVEAGMLVDTEGHIWAVRPEIMRTLGMLHGHIFAEATVAQLKELEERNAARAAANGSPKKGVAVIPLQGLITPQPSLLAMLFGVGGGGLMGFKSDLRDAAASPDVSSIVINIDSPGGFVDQIPEVAAEIRAARDQKPIVAVANTTAASAAYWLASQAHEVVVTPSGEIGSIGVYQIHRDMSKAFEDQGIQTSIVSAGKYKIEGNPYEPLDPSARDAMQEGVDDFYAMFVNDVAAGRGVDPAAVSAGYGEGRTLTAKRAVTAGLADRVATLEATVGRLAGGRAKVRRTAADRQMIEYDENFVPAGDVGEKAMAVYSSEEKGRLLDTLAGLR